MTDDLDLVRRSCTRAHVVDPPAVAVFADADADAAEGVAHLRALLALAAVALPTASQAAA